MSVSRSVSRSRSRSRSPKRRSRSRSRSNDRHRDREPMRFRDHRGARDRYDERDRYDRYDRHDRYDDRHDNRGYGGGRGYDNYRPRPRQYREKSPYSNRRRHQGNRDAPEPSRCLGIFGLSTHTEESEVRRTFEPYGELDTCQLVMDRQSGYSRGFAFVYYKHVDDAIEAKEKTTGMEVDGRPIRVDYSITERAHTPTPGVYLGERDARRPRDPPPRRRRSNSRSASRSRSPERRRRSRS